MPNDNTQAHSIIKDGEVIVDQWQLISECDDTSTTNIPSGHAIVPLAIWQAQPALQTRDDIGVWLQNDVDIAEIADDISKLPLIAIEFPVFMDGRGFSLARLLRERYHYQGEIRAIGHPIRDQLCYLKRCGFNAFSFIDKDIDLNAALESLNDFTETYQTAVDTPSPLFRRRA